MKNSLKKGVIYRSKYVPRYFGYTLFTLNQGFIMEYILIEQQSNIASQAKYFIKWPINEGFADF